MIHFVKGREEWTQYFVINYILLKLYNFFHAQLLILNTFVSILRHAKRFNVYYFWMALILPEMPIDTYIAYNCFDVHQFDLPLLQCVIIWIFPSQNRKCLWVFDILIPLLPFCLYENITWIVFPKFTFYLCMVTLFIYSS